MQGAPGQSEYLHADESIQERPDVESRPMRHGCAEGDGSIWAHLREAAFRRVSRHGTPVRKQARHARLSISGDGVPLTSHCWMPSRILKLQRPWSARNQIRNDFTKPRLGRPRIQDYAAGRLAATDVRSV
jgi:hypothetical protein